MPFPLTPEQITSAINTPQGFKTKTQDVAANWPIIEAALCSQGIGNDLVCIAAIATVKVETPTFRPVHESGSAGYFTQHYQGRVDLGNTRPGDGILFAGRGYIQITGRSNYRKYGQVLGVDLEGFPDRALDPGIAASILAHYFRDHGVAAAAISVNWERVRKLVNGGKNGLTQFLKTESSLQNAASAQPGKVIAVDTPDAVLPVTGMQTHLDIIAALRKLLNV